MAARSEAQEERVQALLAQVEKDERELRAGVDPAALPPRKPARGADMTRIKALARPRGPAAEGCMPPLAPPTQRRSPREQDEIMQRLAVRPQPRDVEPERRQYLAAKGAWSQPSGGHFNLSKPKGWIDWRIYQTREIPGPGTYAEGQLAQRPPPGGRFNEAKPPSDLDLAIARARNLPGPGGQGPIRSFLNSAGVGKIQVARGKTELDWEILRAKSLPGPGEYHELSCKKTLKDTISGGRFGKHKPKSELENVIHRAREVPGPSHYFPEFSFKQGAAGSRGGAL